MHMPQQGGMPAQVDTISNQQEILEHFLWVVGHFLQQLDGEPYRVTGEEMLQRRLWFIQRDVPMDVLIGKITRKGARYFMNAIIEDGLKKLTIEDNSAQVEIAKQNNGDSWSPGRWMLGAAVVEFSDTILTERMISIATLFKGEGVPSDFDEKILMDIAKPLPGSVSEMAIPMRTFGIRIRLVFVDAQEGEWPRWFRDGKALKRAYSNAAKEARRAIVAAGEVRDGMVTDLPLDKLDNALRYLEQVRKGVLTRDMAPKLFGLRYDTVMQDATVLDARRRRVETDELDPRLVAEVNGLALVGIDVPQIAEITGVGQSVVERILAEAKDKALMAPAPDPKVARLGGEVPDPKSLDHEQQKKDHIDATLNDPTLGPKMSATINDPRNKRVK